MDQLTCSGPNGICPFTGQVVLHGHDCPYSQLVQLCIKQQTRLEKLETLVGVTGKNEERKNMNHALRWQRLLTIYIKLASPKSNGSPPVKQGLQEWTLRPNPRGPGQVHDDHVTFTKTGGSRNAWNCNVLGSIGWRSGIHEWSVVLKTDCHMMVGIAPAETNPDGPNWNSCGLYLSTQSGSVFGSDGTWKQDYAQKCYKKGTTISVRLDLEARTLCFAINGSWFPPAWRNISTAKPLHPSFDIDTSGSTFTIASQRDIVA
jgi:hypothetical protein